MEWIKVEDRLPFEDGKKSIVCLVYTINNEFLVRIYNEFHDCWDDEDGDDCFTDSIGGQITHWTPLPEKPKS